jgi:hypothetical protein
MDSLRQQPWWRRWVRRVFGGALLPLLWNSVTAIAAESGNEAMFHEQVFPLLRGACFECHSHQSERIRGGLVLDSRAGIMAGGENGAVLIPGEPDQSRLIRVVRHDDPHLRMPSKRDPLSPAQIAILENWIRLGAPWPEIPGSGAATGAMTQRPRGGITDEDRAWWAFQPVREPTPPSVRDPHWATSPLDRFVLARMEQEGLAPSPPADPVAFIRRLTFDLTGLPPTPDEVDAFVDAARQDRTRAVAEWVDRLLASPRYGERWARHWLDLVRYAESDGYRVDDYRPTVWRYRDWVVQAFNRDLPYDRFVQAQLAGDELWPDDPQSARVATAFLRHWIYEYNNRDVRGQWQTILNDLTDVTGDLFLGMGIQCARCHDHKFDPILQKDYFRLQAFFAPLLPRQDLPVATASEEAAHANRMAAWRDAAGDSLRELESFEEPVRRRAAESATIKFPEDIQALLRTSAAERSLHERQLAALAQRQIDYEWARLGTHLKGDEKPRHEALQKQVQTFAARKPEPLPMAFTVTDLGPDAPPIHLPKAKDGSPVEPGFLSVLDPRPAMITRPESAPQSTGRRTALAAWITSPDNPLTARVLVNRVWQYHFGRGLAVNASDLGHLGEPPSHPELLDWLAARFVRDGWSLKQLHRLILTSATYGQAASPSPGVTPAADPENRSLARFPTRRLEAEQIRDAMFAATGELDRTAGGPSVDFARPRRSIYSRVTRNVRDPLLEVFDAPDGFASTARRNVTTTPTQALLLINQQFLVQRSRAFARRLVREAGEADAQRVMRAYELALGRSPSPTEQARAQHFLSEQADRVPPERPRVAPFLAEKMPYREGKAALLEPRSVQERFVVPPAPGLPERAFTVEGYALLRTPPPADSYRTLAARWDGDSSQPGWALAVAGKGVTPAPQTLILRLNSATESGRRGNEVSSGVVLDLNKPYYLAASVQPVGEDEAVVTFVVKDASNDCEPPQMVEVRAPGRVRAGGTTPFTIGALSGTGGAGWDGLVDDLRLSSTALPVSQLLLNGDAIPASCVGWWRFDASPGAYRDATASANHLVAPPPPADDALDSRTQALADFCHVLMNSNEFLYTD